MAKNKTRLPKSPPLTLPVQDLRIRRHFPQFKYVRKGSYWIGTLTPTEHSPTYTVKLTYRLFTTPTVHILHPQIRQDAKHRYDDSSLCLYYPRDRSWVNQMFLIETFIPWTALWLLFYEYWLKSGVWLGPEAPHKGRKTRKA